MQQLAEVRISRRAGERLESGHVWVYASDVESTAGARGGDPVRVTAPKGRRMGIAHYSSSSQIALRLLTRGQEPIDADFYRTRIAAAAAHRRRFSGDTTAYRLIFSEGDQLPGLIVDRYGDTLVMQNLTQGMEAAKSILAEALLAETGASGIWQRNDAVVRDKEGLERISGPLAGDPPSEVDVVMNGLRFRADIAGGQKTGVYLDQRENYLAAARWGRGRALDCFTSTGGFALHLARGCERVEAVDSGAAALAAARANAEANGIANIDFREADVFHLLSGYSSARRRFDTVVLDPPAFTKSRAAVEGALRGYRDINRRAMEILSPGGTLITCSCSHHVSEAALAETVAAAGLEARRTVRVLERRIQAVDHPVLLTVPETLYLKCLILEIL